VPTAPLDPRADAPGEKASLRSRLGSLALVALAVLCCLAAPLLIGAAGALTLGAVLGVGAGAVALVALCVFTVRRLTTREGC
jgi:hypothetical protein